MISDGNTTGVVSVVIINESDQSALVLVPEKQLSLAIGRDGQNARLSARLTGWKVDIQPSVLESQVSEVIQVSSNQENLLDDKDDAIQIDLTKETSEDSKDDSNVIDEGLDLELIALEQEIAQLEKEEKENQEKASKSNNIKEGTLKYNVSIQKKLSPFLFLINTNLEQISNDKLIKEGNS